MAVPVAVSQPQRTSGVPVSASVRGRSATAQHQSVGVARGCGELAWECGSARLLWITCSPGACGAHAEAMEIEPVTPEEPLRTDADLLRWARFINHGVHPRVRTLWVLLLD